MFYDSMQIPDERIEIRYPIFALRDHKQAQIALARTNIDILGVRTEVFRPIVEQLPTLIAPTLVVWGKQLCIWPVGHAQVAAKTLPNARLHIFASCCGHHPHLQRPEEFNALVLEFLASDRQVAW